MLGLGRSWCFRVILRKRDILKDHVKMEVGNGRRCRVWLDPWIQGGSIIQQFEERVIYDAGSRRDTRLVDFMGLDGEWRWPLVSLDLMNIWDRIQRVTSCSSVEDRWVWVPGSYESFSITSAWETLFVLIVVRLDGRVYYGVGEIFLSTPFVLGCLSGIGWVLERG